jgi:outer membrane protein W
MNRIICALIGIVLIPHISNGQFTKGTRVAGFSLGGLFFDAGETDYSAQSPTTGYRSSTNSLGFRLTPSLGYFISNETLLGARLLAGFRYDKYIDAANNITFRKKEDRVSEWGLGVFARHYLGSSGKYLPYGQVNIDAGIGQSRTEGFSYTSTYRESYTGKSKGNFFSGAGLQIGFTRMLSSTIGLDISAGYEYRYEKNNIRTDTDRDLDLDGIPDEQLVSDISTKSRNHGLMISLGLIAFIK